MSVRTRSSLPSFGASSSRKSGDAIAQAKGGAHAPRPPENGGDKNDFRSEVGRV